MAEHFLKDATCRKQQNKFSSSFFYWNKGSATLNLRIFCRFMQTIKWRQGRMSKSVKNDYTSPYRLLFSSIPNAKMRADIDNVSAPITPGLNVNTSQRRMKPFVLKTSFSVSPWDRGGSSLLPTSLGSGWDQPLLGTLVVVTLQLPCERERRWKEGRGRRQEEGMNQNTIKGTVTSLRAQGQLIRG